VQDKFRALYAGTLGTKGTIINVSGGNLHN
jgi:hypothetical protein